MINVTLPTRFAAPGRLPADILSALSAKLGRLEELALMERMPCMVFLANSCRQIVYCNPAFARAVAPLRREQLTGLRPGEALGCIYSGIMDAGCGCSEYCRHCGAVQAILKSLQGVEDCRECHILARDGKGVHAIDVQILSRPFVHEGQSMSLNIALDVSHERRLSGMNRTFLHSMINAAGGLDNMFALLASEGGEDLRSHIPLLRQSALSMLQEVLYQYDVMALEAGKLVVNMAMYDLASAVARLAEQLGEHAVARGRKIVLHGQRCMVRTDLKLLRHVLTNLLTNALEATPYGGEVHVRWSGMGAVAVLHVDNAGAMDEEIALQLFKRYVSTKGEDRGLGLYMAKVLTENHLGGRLAYEPFPGTIRFSLTLPGPPSSAI